MRFELRATAYDVMESVHVHMTLHQTTDNPTEPNPAALTWTSAIPGEGQTDPREWTRDALLALLEGL